VLLEIFLEFLTTFEISPVVYKHFKVTMSCIVPCSSVLDIIKSLFFLKSRVSTSTSQKHLFDNLFLIFITRYIISRSSTKSISFWHIDAVSFHQLTKLQGIGFYTGGSFFFFMCLSFFFLCLVCMWLKNPLPRRKKDLFEKIIESIYSWRYMRK